VSAPTEANRVALVTLGCARNEVDSEELAARLSDDGWAVTTDGEGADLVLVNTCGFVEEAKQESIDTLLAASDTGAKVVATGCLAERYGRTLAKELPEADAVLGFDHYPEIANRLRAVLAGERIESHVPRDRRALLPITPVERRAAPVVVPGHAAADEHAPAHLKVLRKRLSPGPVALLKLASGCDRRCSFCAIPSYRGAFVSRTPDELLAEAQWLAGQGARELVLVSENSSSYGKDLGDTRLLEKLLPQLAVVPGIGRVRVSYLQPAETRPGLIQAIATTPGVAPYFDLSFQHSSEPVLRRMRRFGSTERFLELLSAVRSLEPAAGVRTNVIVGFPGETRADVAELERFLCQARLDAIGVFGYSDEDGTEAATLPGKVRRDTIRRRNEKLSSLADRLVTERAAERVGEIVEVLVESISDGMVEGRAAHQAPEVDGTTTIRAGSDFAVGDLVRARVVASDGVDLHAEPLDGGPLGARP
jgi:ribosomal protein S12 methylthiotransferase RimO